MARDSFTDAVYNLKAVVAQTGVTAHALRAWERRYGLPQPGRTEAGHRVYSRRDIDMILWLVARQEEGLRIGHAVSLWRSLEEDGLDPLAAMHITEHETKEPQGDRIVDFQREWVSACLSFDERSADELVTRALATYPLQTVVSQVVREGIAQIGQGWYEGQVTPQQEHFASSLAIRRVESMVWSTPAPTRRGRVLIASPPHEIHTLGPMMLELFLRRAGWEATHLGADVPLDGLASTISATRPRLVILGAQTIRTAAELLDVATAIRSEDGLVGFGGGIFNRVPRLRKRIPGHFLGTTLEDAAVEVETIMVSTPQVAQVEEVGGVYRDALSCCSDQLLRLQTSVWTDLQPGEADRSVLRDLNAEFVQVVVAALKLGDTTLAGEYLDWVEGRGDHQRVRRDLLRRYLDAYRQAVETHMGANGTLIVEWLDGWMGREHDALAGKESA
jgi:DNA-binding transcriptional MerR regulator